MICFARFCFAVLCFLLFFVFGLLLTFLCCILDALIFLLVVKCKAEVGSSFQGFKVCPVDTSCC